MLLILGLLAAACTTDDDDSSGAPTDVPPTASPAGAVPPATDLAVPSTVVPTETETETDDPEFETAGVVTPGVEQLTIVNHTPGTELTLFRAGAPAAVGIVDEYGSLLFRNIEPGPEYSVAAAGDNINVTHTVLDRITHPTQAFYAEQRLVPGLNYIEMRDGTTLSANVVLPGAIEGGPYPTVVEYSGYTPADPESVGFKDLFTQLGYAYVGVNMRGTGCSGGSFRYFEYAQSLDGYDVIEAIAAQPWVFENRPGMVGVSYPGISQLFVAQTQPPSLAAITPFSVIDDSYNSTLYPGGLLNTGFAVDWTQDRVDNGRPAIDPEGNIVDEGGQAWAKDQIRAGDTACAENQSLRNQNPDLIAEIFESPFYDSAQSNELSPRLFVDKITVPTFVAGAWQDEQTGGRFPTMLDRFTGTDHLYVSLMNGLHTDSIGPANFPRWIEFLDLYVAERVPTLDTARLLAPLLAGGIFGTTDFEIPDDRFADMTYDEALAAFEAEPPIRVLFEQGAGNDTARAPVPRFVEAFDAWPIPTTEPTDWWLGQDGRLVDAPESDNGQAAYLALPDGVPATFYEGNSSDIWRTDVTWDWQEPAPGTAATFLSDPLNDTVTMIGSGSADLWVNSNLGDTDLEVTISEVRPDGQEMYIQSGWLRASHRALDDELSTALRPAHTHLESDAEALTDGKGEQDFDLARVEIFPFAHVFRAGSQVRISIDAPGGNRPVWVFDTISNSEQVTIGFGGDYPSKIVLPVVPDIEAPVDFPECGALRGQPCRPYTG